MVIEVVAEFRPFFLFAFDHFGNQMSIFPEVVTHFSQQCGILRETLHQNIASAIERGFGVGNAFIGINVAGGQRFRILLWVLPQRIGQRLKACFNRDLPTGAALRLVGKI